MSDREHQSPPATLFRSFLLIAGAYIMQIMVVGAAALILLMIFFPGSFEILNGEPDKFNSIFAEEPERVFPPEFLWSVLGVNCVVSFVLGFLIARFSPVAHFTHAIFFAAILFVHFLQSAIGAGDSLQRMFVLFMGASPVAAILGANFYLQRWGGELQQDGDDQQT